MWESGIGCSLLIGFIAKITPRQSRVGVVILLWRGWEGA